MATKIMCSTAPFKERQEAVNIASLPDNCLAVVDPELAAQWHPTKNGELTPDMVTKGSDKKVWWFGKCGHEWQSSVSHRALSNRGCPYCAGKKVLKGFNDLATTNPSLALEWHTTKNGELMPYMFTKGSHKKVWWKCKEGHTWQAQIKSRNNGCGCPTCRREAQTSFAEQAVFYYIKRFFPDATNRDSSLGKELDVYIPSIRTAVEYDGEYYHKNTRRDMEKNVWCKNIGLRLIRIRESDCKKLEGCEVITRKDGNDDSLNSTLIDLMKLLGISECSVDVTRNKSEIFSQYIFNKKQKSLMSQNQEVASEWHPTKNNSFKPDMVNPFSNKKVWWMCKDGHEWQATISDRSNGRKCPYCSGKKTLKGFNDLATVSPRLAAEWHPTKNGNLTPDIVTKGSKNKVWWQCKNGHEWKAVICGRYSGSGCPYCSGRYAAKGVNDLNTTNPRLASEWHPTKNGNLTPYMITGGAGKKVWWQCKNGHEWKAAIYSRSSGCGCPYCSGKRTLKGFNDLATVSPRLAAEWYTTKNGKLTPDMVTKCSNKKVWWKCRQGHEWLAKINDRSKGSDCPVCYKLRRSSSKNKKVS